MTATTAASPAIVDTNILLYAFDLLEPTKRPTARRLVLDLLREQRLVLTAQILNEFVWNVTRTGKKRATPIMSLEAAEQIVRRWVSVVPVVHLGPDLTLRAIDGVARHNLSFWDALIWAAAKSSGISTVYSEDGQHGRDVEGVRYENPFVAQPET